MIRVQARTQARIDWKLIRPINSQSQYEEVVELQDEIQRVSRNWEGELFYQCLALIIHDYLERNNDCLQTATS